MSERIWDISPTISPKLAVFPGDTPFKKTELLSFASGNHLTLSTIQATVHLGAHADAPNHYHPKGKGIHSCSLNSYLGPCQVIDVRNSNSFPRILPEQVTVPITQPRVLFRTDTFVNYNQWNDTFRALSPELIHWLADRNVCLVGLDTPSVDPSQSKLLESHQALWQRELAVLEGLILTDIAEGVYELIALPLAIENADASPVRAILRECKNT